MGDIDRDLFKLPYILGCFVGGYLGVLVLCRWQRPMPAVVRCDMAAMDLEEAKRLQFDPFAAIFKNPDTTRIFCMNLGRRLKLNEASKGITDKLATEAPFGAIFQHLRTSFK